MHQVYDRITYGIPGPTGDISPELQEAADNAVSAAATASSAKTAAQSAKAAAEAAAAAAAQSASEATSAVAAPLMTQSEAQAGTVTTSRTVSPKVMGDEIKRLLGSTAPVTTMTAAQAQTGTATTSQRITAKVMGDEIKRLLGATAPITTMTAAQAQTGTSTTSQRITAKVMGDEIDRRIASDVIIISGKSYKRSGTVTATGGTWSEHGSGFNLATKAAPLPFTPPAGWHFYIQPCESPSGYLFGSQLARGSGSMRLVSTQKPEKVECDWTLIED